MLNWIIVAGCAGGVAGFVFGLLVERGRVYLRKHEAELQELQAKRRAIPPIEVPHEAPVHPRFVNGDASLHS